MGLGKIITAIRAQINKLANFFWNADPIAVMRLEYERALGELKSGREGLELYRGFVERVTRQVAEGEAAVARHEARVRAFLQAGDREAAGREALSLQQAKTQLAENQGQLAMHEEAYQNHLLKIQHANKQLVALKDRIAQHEANLKMSEAEAEIARVAEALDMNIGENLTTNLGEVEAAVKDRIDKNRGRARVASDMSSRGVDEVRAEQRMEAAMAEDALRKFEIDLGLVTPESTPVPETRKTLGAADDTINTQEV